MKLHATSMLVLLTGFAATDARAVARVERVPGSYCLPINSAVAADISYNTAGKLFNNGAATQTVTCAVPLPNAFPNTESVTVEIKTSATTSCTLRTSFYDGSPGTSSTSSGTAFSLFLNGSAGLQFMTANLRCAVPAGESLNSVHTNVTGF
jgi:hypothetical protein